MTQNRTGHRGVRLVNTACGGWIAISLVLMQSFFSMTPLDTPSQIAVYAFACSLPILASCLFINNIQEVPFPWMAEEGSKEYDSSENAQQFFFWGSLINFIGIDAAFWHFGWPYGLAFLLTCITVACFWFITLRQLFIAYQQAQKARRPRRNVPPMM